MDSFATGAGCMQSLRVVVGVGKGNGTGYIHLDASRSKICKKGFDLLRFRQNVDNLHMSPLN